MFITFLSFYVAFSSLTPLFWGPLCFQGSSDASPHRRSTISINHVLIKACLADESSSEILCMCFLKYKTLNVIK